MKAGDIVFLKTKNYPQYKGKKALLVRKCGSAWHAPWKVFVAGHIHPYPVFDFDFVEIK